MKNRGGLSKIQDEFHRITMVHLESKFMSKLDEYTPGLLKLFHSKGGTMGLKLKALLLQTPSNPNINITRDVVIRCLMVYLGERTDQLLKEYDDADEDSASQDLAVQGMAIYSIKTNASEGSHDIGIVVEGIRVLTSQGTIPRACCMLIGIACSQSCLSQAAKVHVRSLPETLSRTGLLKAVPKVEQLEK
ncbi:hypothetical protein NQZ68_014001 [Dissostichus eleginoides]|nr:hypothetical protein NQZ68_014001 [Dissostichus eleginoides]